MERKRQNKSHLNGGFPKMLLIILVYFRYTTNIVSIFSHSTKMKIVLRRILGVKTEALFT